MKLKKLFCKNDSKQKRKIATVEDAENLHKNGYAVSISNGKLVGVIRNDG